MRKSRRVPVFLVVLSAAGLWAQPSILIRDAQVVDGTGAAGRKASLRISGDRIEAIGQLQPRAGEQVIDASGLVLAPGFIDMHNHSDRLDADLDAASQTSQGITTILVGQDGGSQWPIADYLSKRRAAPASLNVQTLVGHATVRTQVMGKDYNRQARPEEIARMAQLVDQAMRDGAAGLSSGLEYEVGSYSTTEELIALAKAAASYGGIYVSHVRDEGDHALDSFREEIRIGEEAHLPVEISHIKLGTAAVWGKAGDVIQLVNAARKRGVDVTADCYPYDAWASGLTVLVLDKQYDNPASVGKGLADVGGAENVTITSCKAHPEYEGHTLAGLAKAQQISPVALYSQIVKQGGAGVVCKAMKDSDIRQFYQQPWVMVGSDGGLGMRHPRGAGTYPKVLGDYVRERNWLTLPEAIRKMTSAPAARLKLTDRGTIKAGAFADLVLFDAAKVRDRATFAQPFLISTGIAKVFVNGALVWSDDKATGQHPGRVLSGGQAALQPFVDNRSMAGAVTLVANKDKVLSVETVGYADIAARKEMRPDSLFWIASMSKPITATALMMLVDEGKINIDDPVEKYLPEFKGQWLAVKQDKEHILLKKPVHPITIKNILTHTSGMPATSAMEKPTLDLLPLRDAVRSYAMTPLTFQPDSEYKYANSGINTAGRIIEVVSGMPYEQFLQERLFTPLSMKDTTFWPDEEQLTRLAKSYRPTADKKDLEETVVDQLRYPLNDRGRQPMPAGGLFSTAQDLARFCQMILRGGELDGKRYVSEAAVKQMTSLQTGGLEQAYGFGWSTLERAATDGRTAGSFGHGGAYKTAMWIDPGHELVMVLLRQHAGELTDESKKVEPVFLKAAETKYAKSR